MPRNALLLLVALLALLACAATASAATFTVDSAAEGTTTGGCDIGDCTLDDAITAANADPAFDRVAFNVGGGGPQTLTRTSSPPSIESEVVIDGTSQGPYTGQPNIELDGNGPGTSAGWGIRIGSGGAGSVVSALTINGFDTAVLVEAGAVTISGSWIGLNETGSAAAPNGLGIRLEGIDGLVGGFNPGDRNVIAANEGPGVDIGPTADGSAVVDNWVGMTADPVPFELGNEEAQVRVLGADRVLVQDNVLNGGAGVGGLDPADGLFLLDTDLAEARGNIIGLRPTDSVPMENDRGVVVAGIARRTKIGPADGVKANTISGNRVGVEVSATPLSADPEERNVVGGNRIGLQIGGIDDSAYAATAVPNTEDGVLVTGSNASIGTIAANDRNMISGNGGAGVRVPDASDDVAVLGNGIWDNGGLGIDVGDPGPTPPATAGAPNAPTLSVVSAAGDNVRAIGVLDGAPDSTYRVELFQNDACDAPHPSGEGKRFVGATQTVQTNGSGQADLYLDFYGGGATAGDTITATTTLLDGAEPRDTGEHSACSTATSGSDLIVSHAASATTAATGETVTHTVTVRNAPGTGRDTSTGGALTFNLPPGTEVVEADGCPRTDDHLDCASLPDLAPGAQTTKTFRLRHPAAGLKSTQAVVHNEQADETILDRIANRQVDVVAPAGGGGTTTTAESRRADPEPQAPPPAPAGPAPVLARTVVAQEVSGTVTVTLPSGQTVGLGGLQGVPTGAIVDATQGRVRLVTAGPPGQPVQVAEFYGGVFRLTQEPTGLVDLALVGEIGPCPAGRAKARAAQAGKRRKLWGSGKGRFRVSGKHSAAVVRGTDWSQEDSCDGTLTEVTSGVVTVADYARGDVSQVPAGRSKLVRPGPLPALGRSVNVIALKPGAKLGARRLAAFQQVAAGRAVDAVRGEVRVVAATVPGAPAVNPDLGALPTYWATFKGGAFKATQARDGLTTLTLSGPLACPTGARARAAAAKRRRLWGDGRGRFRTSGRHAAAVVRGTTWEQIDTCRGTETRVIQGVVEVEDFAKKSKVVVRTGGRYLARPKGRR